LKQIELELLHDIVWVMDFFNKAKAVHSDKYKYFNDYINRDLKINVECKIHGIFKVMARQHLKGSACKECDLNDKYKNCLNELNKVHPNYEYHKESFNDLKKIKITCKVHGMFQKNYNVFLKSNGCSKCSRNVYDAKDYFVKVKEIHNNKYSYNEKSFKIMTSYIEIFCKDHGWFKQPAFRHLECGCKKCFGNHRNTTEDFIIKANIIHNNLYNYSKTIYLTSNDKVIITCSKNHDFKQSPKHHIQGRGCSKCVNIISKKETAWLNYLNIKEEYRNVNIQVDGLPRGKNVDAFDSDTNTAYEFLGNYWHGNPNMFDLKDFNSRSKKTFQELYDDTMYRIDLMKKHGYNVVYIWEQDFDKSQK